MAESQSPFIQLLPPTTDYVTYLTFIEHNLAEEHLPVLHEVLQDAQLTTNIGWDLVHLLLPLLPASQDCLLDVARLGNPREVILKVAEALRFLELDGLEESLEEEEDAPQNIKDADLAGSSTATTKQEPGTDLPSPLVVQQYQILLSMLSILHPRIKTKYPSRFLSTSLQAALVAFSKAAMFDDEITAATVQFIKALTGPKRPTLPPRGSSSQVLLTTTATAAPDPEAQNDPPSADEVIMERRLLQSFLTHVLEDYMLSLHSPEDIPGLAWSIRLQEKLHPERVLTSPVKLPFSERFTNSDKLQAQLDTVGQIVALAQDLEVSSNELLKIILDTNPEATGHPAMEDDPPAETKDIPLSKTGSLFLLAARKAAEELYDQTRSTPDIPIFPCHAAIVKNFVGTTSQATIGLEPEPLIDTILFLGLAAIENNDIGEPPSDVDFAQYLQNTSLISANTPSPSLRFAAHYLTSTVLRSHPTDIVRLSFIRDTLEYCPYSNLKSSAVGWLKGEILEANPPSDSTYPPPTSSDGETPSIFATPVALSTLSPFLFPDLTEHFAAPSLSETYLQFREELGFYLAALNFFYLLLIAKHLHEPLSVKDLHATGDIGGSYIGTLRSMSAKLKEGLAKTGELYKLVDGEEGAVESRMELEILDHAIVRVEEEVKALSKA